jgi:hypothetical protein
MLAIHNPKKTRFLSASQMDVSCCCSVAMTSVKRMSISGRRHQEPELSA